MNWFDMRKTNGRKPPKNQSCQHPEFSHVRVSILSVEVTGARMSARKLRQVLGRSSRSFIGVLKKDLQILQSQPLRPHLFAEACNGIFRYDGLHQQKPLFKADSGAIIYFNRPGIPDWMDWGEERSHCFAPFCFRTSLETNYVHQTWDFALFVEAVWLRFD